MEKIDKLITEALAEEDRALLEGSGEPGYIGLVLGQFRGPNGWVTWLSTAAMLAYGVLAVWAAWECFVALEVLVALKWGLLATVSVIVVGMFKLNVLYTAQINRVMRALRRLELRQAMRED